MRSLSESRKGLPVTHIWVLRFNHTLFQKKTKQNSQKINEFHYPKNDINRQNQLRIYRETVKNVNRKDRKRIGTFNFWEKGVQ